ncbi:Hint domain-containing protein [Bradyrhizobium sp. WSM471]|uniref:Hint domain-containing protein n=1 Tax=Bradyrhizobium sp. WSM471 TaxID=319017 RepID=UPI00024D2254|nr:MULTISPECIES: Hint domain-containing protein [Bradyrhizobium]EHR01382.1 hypothetical protein Bra471DRAFT_02101 [Bradyrhizobium sp. WSM471]UFW43446.1 Hint domain-containing protein [Bradyrhizobium canariense]
MATKTWDGGAFTSNWGDANNWSPNGVPGASDDVTLVSSNGNSTLSINLNVNVSIKSLTITGDDQGGSTHFTTLTVQSGKTLTTSGAINLSNSFSVITGAGTITAGAGISGSGTITASGGTLDVFGTINSGIGLTIGTSANSTLKIEGTATASSAISIGDPDQTLEIGPSGSLTINAAESITSGTIKLSGGTLKDASGITIGSGAKLTGFGVIDTGTTVNGSGTITASGGTLEFKGAVDSTGTASTFHIASNSTLKFDNTVGTGSIKPTIAFDAATGTLDLSSMSGESSNFHGVVTSFKSGDQIKLTVASAGTETYTTSFSGGQTTLIIKQGSTTVGTVVLQGDYRNAHFSIGESGTLDTITTDAACFMAGTMIQTPNGGVAVEELKRGDLVLTSDGQVRPVSWLGVQTVSTRFADKMRVWPIRVLAGALEQNVPSRDLLLSPDHALLVEGALVQAGALVNGTSILRETNVPEVFVYYHVELDDHSLILAENTPAETFVDNVDRLNFDNWAEYQELYPEGKPMTELSYPRAKAQRQVPVRTRITLAARAQAIGADATAVA